MDEKTQTDGNIPTNEITQWTKTPKTRKTPQLILDDNTTTSKKQQPNKRKIPMDKNIPNEENHPTDKNTQNEKKKAKTARTAHRKKTPKTTKTAKTTRTAQQTKTPKHPTAATQAMAFVSLGGSFHNNACAGRSIGRYIARLDGAEVVVNNFDFVLLGPTSRAEKRLGS